MVIDQEVEDFLAHYGKAGMRWGVRSSTPSSSAKRGGSKPKRKKMSKDTKGILQVVGITTAIAVGTIAAAEFMNRHGRTKLAPLNIPKPNFDNLRNIQRDINNQARSSPTQQRFNAAFNVRDTRIPKGFEEGLANLNNQWRNE